MIAAYITLVSLDAFGVLAGWHACNMAWLFTFRTRIDRRLYRRRMVEWGVLAAVAFVLSVALIVWIVGLPDVPPLPVPEVEDIRA